MIRLLFFVIFSFFSFNAFSNDNLLTIQQQIERLQREVSDLSQSIFKDDSKINKQQDNNLVEQSDNTSTNEEISERDETAKKEVIKEPYDQLSLDIPQTDTPIKSGGVPLTLLGFGDSDDQNFHDKLPNIMPKRKILNFVIEFS